MKYCSKFGHEINEDAVICINCGCKTNELKSSAPIAKLKTNRGLIKFILLSLITFGIYGLVVMSSVSSDINIIASKYDGKNTMHYCLVFFIFTGLTLGIVPIVWYHKLSARIGKELFRRNINYSFGSGSFWGWNVLGAFFCWSSGIYSQAT